MSWRWKEGRILRSSKCRGTWVAQWVECLSLDLSSGLLFLILFLYLGGWGSEKRKNPKRALCWQHRAQCQVRSLPTVRSRPEPKSRVRLNQLSHPGVPLSSGLYLSVMSSSSMVGSIAGYEAYLTEIKINKIKIVSPSAVKCHWKI